MHFLIWLGGVRGIKDSQCGFKLFSRDAARWLFPNVHVRRWCFDTELIVIAQKKLMQIAEVPVEWHEVEGSKMKISGMVRMAVDMLQIALYHRVGIWSIRWKSQVPESEEQQ
jgi:dolichyl-phosphate beta-glucosyltransferase